MQSIKKNESSTSSEAFNEYSICQYEIINPFPNQTLELNIYRQTNDIKLGVYYQKRDPEWYQTLDTE